ncbi:MAG: tripartite tricarboxylate transporter TctB family protein [Oscillospiraceae bacterium]
MKKTNVLSIAGSITVMFFALIFLVYSLQYPMKSDMGPGPGMLPFWLSVLLVILAGAYMVVAFRGQDLIDELPDSQGKKNILMILLSMALYVVMLKFLGAVTAGVVFLFLHFRKSYKWPVALLIALVASAALFALFALLLDVNLPVNMFGV